MSPVSLVDDHGTELLGRYGADELGARVVGTLQGRGHRAGSRVAFCAPNSALLLAAVWGCLRAGYVPVLLSADLTRRERTEMLSDVEADAVLGPAELVDAAAGPIRPLTDRFHCRPIHFTSGTSGRPRAVWSGWLTPERAVAAIEDEHMVWEFTDEDRHLVCAPLSHSAPLRFALHTLYQGGSVLVPAAPASTVLDRLLTECSPTTTFLPPAALQRLLDAHRPKAPALRLLAHAGSPCPSPVQDAAVETFGAAVVREFYGSTEGQFTVCTPAEAAVRPGTVGRARPGRELRVDEVGRIWCRPPRHARFEYWGDPVQTQQSWDGDWFTAGDLGRLDDAGYLYLDGRRTDLILHGSENVYPAEIERVLAGLPGVQQAVAFGLDDGRWGQQVCVAVVGSVSKSEVIGWCARRLAAYKRPLAVYLVDGLPLTHSGKVDRSRVAAALHLPS